MPRLVAVALLTLSAPALFGGVVFDHSFGKGGPAPFANSNYMIPATYGKQVGGNLFQSFSQFNLATVGSVTESATFTGPSLIPNTPIQNILARVTGGPSSIDGTINSDIQGANLFFLNPAGVMFGPHAQLNVSGSVAISTANYVKMADGGRFNANLGGGDMLTSAPVSAFGFLNSAPNGVSIVGNNSFDSNFNLVAFPLLTVAPGKSFSIVAGDITMNGGEITGEGSRVNLVSVKSTGEAKLDATDINSAVDVTQFTAMGTIDLTNLATIDTSGPGGGPVVIRGGNLYVDNSVISSNTTGAIQGGAIDIALAGDVKIINGGKILTETDGGGRGGDISISANSLLIGGGTAGDAELQADTVGNGNAGNITLQAGDVKIINSAFIDAETFGTGDAGNVTLRAGDVKIINRAVIFTGTQSGGHGGDISISANSLLIDGGTTRDAELQAISTGAGNGDAGNVTLRAGDVKIINGGKILTETGGGGHGGDISISANSFLIDGTAGFANLSADTFGNGNAGNITLQAGDVKIINGGFILADTFSSGNGGNVNVIADSLLIEGGVNNIFGSFGPVASGILATAEVGSSGHAGNVMVQAGNLTITAGGEISSSAFGLGDGGTVNVIADSLLIDGAGSDLFPTGIFAVAELGSSGRGGGAVVSADDLSLQNNGAISAASFTSAAAGSLQLSLETLSMNSGSSISSANTGSGAAGSVVIETTGPMALTGGSSVSTSARSGNAGDVAVQTDDLTITDGAEISSSTSGRGNGGNVSVFANSLFLDRGSSNSLTGITAQAELGSSGNAGSVTVRSGDLTIIGGGEISSNTFGHGNGGNVNVAADSLLIDGAGSNFFTGISAEAAAGQGKGGEVGVSANSLLMQNGGGVSAISLTSATAGSVSLTLGTLRMDSDSSISSANTGSGSAGGVSIDTTGSVKLRHGSTISTSSKLSGAGNIELISDGVIKLNSESSITASAGTNGGNIEITAPSLVYLLDSSITATAGSTGGNITIDPLFIVLNNSPISASAVGQGGKIRLQSNFFFDSNSPITATGGIANGTITITAPELDLGAELITLPDSLVSAANQLQERCTALLQGDFSSFISIGRGGTEPEPDELQSEF